MEISILELAEIHEWSDFSVSFYRNSDLDGKWEKSPFREFHNEVFPREIPWKIITKQNYKKMVATIFPNKSKDKLSFNTIHNYNSYYI